MSEPVASVVITTRNRRDDTLNAVGSAFAQDCPVEVLVYDDASEDGTAEAVRQAYPQARVFALQERTGYIVNRNRGFHDARAPVVFSLDDDAYFSAPDIVSRTLAMLERTPDAAAVAIPYIEPLNRVSLSSQRAPFRAKAGEPLRAFTGCAHAIRVEAALAQGGYREFFVHQNEERDLSMRLHRAGQAIVYGDSAPIVHMVSPKRTSQRVVWYGTRGQIFRDVLNVPAPEVLARVPWTIWGMLRYRFSWSGLPLRLRAVASGLAEVVGRLPERTPMTRRQYARFLELSSHGPMHWDGDIPPPCHEAPAG